MQVPAVQRSTVFSSYICQFCLPVQYAEHSRSQYFLRTNFSKWVVGRNVQMLSHSLGAIILRHVLYWLQEFFRSKPQIPRGAFSEKHPLWTASFSPRPLPTYIPVCPSWLPEGHETECLCDIAQYVFESKKTLSIIKLIFLAFGGNSLFFLSDMEIGTKAPALVTELP